MALGVTVLIQASFAVQTRHLYDELYCIQFLELEIMRKEGIIPAMSPALDKINRLEM